MLELMAAPVKGMAHITGGGLTENIIRVVPDAWLQAATGWSPGAAFGWQRNHFDRFIHLAFGLCFAPADLALAAPALATARRRGQGFALAVMLVMCTSLALRVAGMGHRAGPVAGGRGGLQRPAGRCVGCARRHAVGHARRIAGLAAGTRPGPRRRNAMTVRIAVLASGRGSNLQAILQAIAAGTLDADVVGVFSDKPDRTRPAAACRRSCAGRATRRHSRTAPSFDAALADAVAASRPDWVVCAGYMRILGEAFVQRFRGTPAEHPSVAAAEVPRACIPTRAHCRPATPNTAPACTSWSLNSTRAP
jgi:hypothetical protein